MILSKVIKSSLFLSFILSSLLCVAAFSLPAITSAHEVYVLDAAEIAAFENAPSVSLLEVFRENVTMTLLWAFIVGFLIISVFLISISSTLENKFDGYLVNLKKYAPFVARVTVGLAFIMCGFKAALFGPELPFDALFGTALTPLVQILFCTLGMLIMFGIFTRVAGIISLGFFLFAVTQHGVYMTTYANYLAEFLVLAVVGGHKFAVTDERPVWWHLNEYPNYLAAKYGELSFFVLRVGFGVSLIFSSVYAKVLHNQLAIAVVHDFNLVQVFGFPAEFIVFGAAIIEVLLGVFFILGIEIRFNAIVINIFLTLSLFYFGEAVWPHIILIGIPIAFFCYGYDKYSLEGYFFKRGNREPIF